MEAAQEVITKYSAVIINDNCLLPGIKNHQHIIHKSTLTIRSGIRKTTRTRNFIEAISDVAAFETAAGDSKIALGENGLLNAIFNSGLMAVAITDDEHNFIELNKKFCTLFNCSMADLQGKSLGFLFPAIEQVKIKGSRG